MVGRPALGVEGGELRVPDDAGVVGQVIQSRHPGYKPGEPSETLRQAARERSGGDVAVNGSRRSSGRGVDFWQSA